MRSAVGAFCPGGWCLAECLCLWVVAFCCEEAEDGADALDGADCAARALQAASSDANAKHAAMVFLRTKIVALFFDDRNPFLAW